MVKVMQAARDIQRIKYVFLIFAFFLLICFWLNGILEELKLILALVVLR
jgi:hypothetical protein